MYPAAWAPWDNGQGEVKVNPGLTPIVSVGALNPSRRSDALFSNAGHWVRVYLPGASLMSTMPPFQGGLQPLARTRFHGRVRSTIDPDDYRGGFAIWSGTSFAAPLMAGVFANFLMPDLEKKGARPTAPDKAVRRAWDVVTATTTIRKTRPRQSKSD
jgi:subtilisin family serine protease